MRGRETYVDCTECPLRRRSIFRPLQGAELDFVRTAKVDQRWFEPRSDVAEAGHAYDSVWTLFSGWAYRYQTLNGRGRQILDFLLPGDLIGLQFPMTGELRYSVASVTEVSVCILDSERFRCVFDEHPNLSEALLTTLLFEEQRADARQLLLGRQRPLARLTYLLLELRERLVRRGLIKDSSFELPLTYEHLADAIGASRSQVGASLSELRERGWARLEQGVVTILDQPAMESWCHYKSLGDPARRALI